MFRKRKQPAPHFRLPPPYEPITGNQAQLYVPGIYPYCTLVQVAKEDTEDNYVICRGWDTRLGKYMNYEEGVSPGMAVAKPYGSRYAGMYTVGEVYTAVLPIMCEESIPATVPWKGGQNAGKAATTQGHPADLAEEVVHLQTTESTYVQWMLLDGGAQRWFIGKTTEEITAGTSGTVEQHEHAWVAMGVFFTVYNPHDFDIPTDYKVRWTKYPKWTGWIVEPWHFVECP